jgi:hypothetical protein
MNEKLKLALKEDTNVSLVRGQTSLEKKEIGKMILPTGRVIAVDPSVFDGYEHPFLQEVSPGEYPAFLTIVHYKSKDQRVAFATIEFKNELPVRWELAVPRGNIKQGKFFGYSVDSGIGCFMDEETANKYKSLAEDEGFFDKLSTDLENTYVPTWSYSNTVINEDNGGNIILFSSGMGDGTYPSYFGINSKGEICCLVTDFLLVK